MRRGDVGEGKLFFIHISLSCVVMIHVNLVKRM